MHDESIEGTVGEWEGVAVLIYRVAITVSMVFRTVIPLALSDREFLAASRASSGLGNPQLSKRSDVMLVAKVKIALVGGDQNPSHVPDAERRSQCEQPALDFLCSCQIASTQLCDHQVRQRPHGVRGQRRRFLEPGDCVLVAAHADQ